MPPVDIGDQDRFVLRQRTLPIINRYEIGLAVPGSDEFGEPVAFVEQARFAFKEDIRFYTDASKAVELLRIKARQRFDPRARYDVTDASGATIGEIQKVFGASLLRSSYALDDASGEQTATARERSLPVALFRRVIGFVPFVDYVSNWLPIPYHFEFRRGDRVLGTHVRRRMKLRDTYVIDVSADTDRSLDRRLVLAAAVGMDALQAR